MRRRLTGCAVCRSIHQNLMDCPGYKRGIGIYDCIDGIDAALYAILLSNLTDQPGDRDGILFDLHVGRKQI